MAEGKAASSTLRLEVNSTLVRWEIVRQYCDKLKQVHQKWKDNSFVRGAEFTLGGEAVHKVLPVVHHLFTVDLTNLIALIEHRLH